MTVDGVNSKLFEGDYKIVPQGFKHKYRAITKTYILEIQFGDTCEERDIVRL